MGIVLQLIWLGVYARNWLQYKKNDFKLNGC